jgi:hypothetical protein
VARHADGHGDVFVALTHPTPAELVEAGGQRDLRVRGHVYDLHAIRAHYELAEVAVLAQVIVPPDAEIFGNQFPACRVDPMAETWASKPAHRDPR